MAIFPYASEILKAESEEVYIPPLLRGLYLYLLDNPPEHDIDMETLFSTCAQELKLSKYTISKMLRKLRLYYFIDYNAKSGSEPYQRLLQRFEFLGSYIWIEFDKD